MGSLWTARVLCDGIAALGWQPYACWRRAGPMIISRGSCGFGRKKRDSSDPESGLATALSIAVPYPTLIRALTLWRPESGE